MDAKPSEMAREVGAREVTTGDESYFTNQTGAQTRQWQKWQSSIVRPSARRRRLFPLFRFYAFEFDRPLAFCLITIKFKSDD